MDRRDFLKVLTSVPLALTVDLKKVEAKKIELNLPKGTTTGLIPEGWHTVTVSNAAGKPSETRDGFVYDITFITESGQEVKSFFSDWSVYGAIPFLLAVKSISPDYIEQKVDLSDTIGRKLRVHIEHYEYHKGRKLNHITEYVALEA